MAEIIDQTRIVPNYDIAKLIEEPIDSPMPTILDFKE